MLSDEVDLSILVRSLRERMGLTQEKFAAKLRVTFASVNRWENGKAKPSPLALKQVEDLLRSLDDAGHDLLQQYFEPEE